MEPVVGRKRINRDDKTVKLDRAVVHKAKFIADIRGQSLAEYLTEIVKPIVDRDWPKALKRMNEGAEDETE
jgi:hypothetical protein